MKHKFKSLTLIIIALAAVLSLSGCFGRQAEETPLEQEDVTFEGNPKIQIEMQDGGIMVLELYPEFAPATVQNFVNLVHWGFYDGLTFHRIVKGFMIQGGDPDGDGTGGSGRNIPGEFSQNGFTQNTLNHTNGTISMARSNNPNSASSQFFIVDGEAAFLDGSYAAFGRLIEGEEVLRAIADTPVEANPYSREVSVPEFDVVIKRMTLLRDGN